jgi:hypothetical protein
MHSDYKWPRQILEHIKGMRDTIVVLKEFEANITLENAKKDHKNDPLGFKEKLE